MGTAKESCNKTLLLWKFERIGKKCSFFIYFFICFFVFLLASVGLSLITSNWLWLTVSCCFIEFVNCNDCLLCTMWMTWCIIAMYHMDDMIYYRTASISIMEPDYSPTMTNSLSIRNLLLAIKRKRKKRSWRRKLRKWRSWVWKINIKLRNVT